MPICLKCEVDKSEDKFGTKTYYSKKYDKVYGPYRKSECKVCEAARKLQWCRTNIDKHSDNQHQYYARKTGKDPDKCVRCGPEEAKRRRKKSVKRYYENNPQVFLESGARRRGRKGKATPPWLTLIQRAQMREMYDIAKALDMQTGEKHHVDHVFPLYHKQFCGLHVPWNLRVVTKRENLKKHAKLPKEYEHMLLYAA